MECEGDARSPAGGLNRVAAANLRTRRCTTETTNRHLDHVAGTGNGRSSPWAQPLVTLEVPLEGNPIPSQYNCVLLLRDHRTLIQVNCRTPPDPSL